MPTTYAAPPAGSDAAGPRPDLRGHRLAVGALIERSEAELRARRAHGLVGGFVGGLVVGLALLWLGVPGVAAILVAALINYLLAHWLPTLLLPAGDRRLLTVTDRLVMSFLMSWRRAYGRAQVPRNEEERLLWLAAQSASTTQPDALDIEAGFLLALGRYEDARERVNRLPVATPWWRFIRALALAEIEFDEGGRGDLSEARDEAGRVVGARRSVAIVSLGLVDAARAMVRGDDWNPPIERAVRETGPAISEGLLAGIARTREQLPLLVSSELVLLAALAFVAIRPAA